MEVVKAWKAGKIWEVFNMAGGCMVIDKRICEDTGALRGRGYARVGLCEGGALRGGALRGRGSVRVGFCEGGAL